MRDIEPDDFPVGCRVRTPSGRVGWVDRHRGDHSKRDRFIRVVVRFSPAPRDTVVLQPKLLQRIDKSPQPQGNT